MILEEQARLSTSLLWRLQDNAYLQFGLQSWTSKGVPLHVTSNREIARQYVDVALSALEENPRLTFLELGGGSGRFAYLFLHELLERSSQPIRYLLTDYAEKNVAFWKEHPLFRPFVEKGQLEFCLYNPLKSAPPCSGPLFVIANYFFDSIVQDLYRLEEGHLYEGRITLHSKTEKIEDPDALKALRAEFSYHRLQEPPYKNPSWNALLKSMQDEFDNATFLFPVGGLRVLEQLPSFTLLAADKGFSSEEQIAAWKEPHLNLQGTISFPVNFHLLGRFLKMQGGGALFSSPPDPLLTVGLLSSAKITETLQKSFESTTFAPYLQQPPLDERFFPLCLEESLRFHDLQNETGKNLAALCNTLPQAAKTELIQPQGEVLRIGPAPSGFSLHRHTSLTLDEILSWPLAQHIYDEIYFFAPPTEQLTAKSSLLEREGQELIASIEEKLQLRKIVYSDADLELFFQNTPSTSNPQELLHFFFDLQKRGQISVEQHAAAHNRLLKEGRLLEADLQRFTLQQGKAQTAEIFSLFRQTVFRCLKTHMKKGSCVIAYFPGLTTLYDVEACLDEIIANPWIDYSEEFSLKTRTLCAKIRLQGPQG